MHGAAVSSLLVGENCGTAPGAELHYFAVPCDRDFSFYATALRQILEYNKGKSQDQQIRVVSCSIGYTKDKSLSEDKNSDDWDKTLKEAKDAGVIVVHVSMDDLRPCGCGSVDKENIYSYRENQIKQEMSREEINEALKSKTDISEEKRARICDYLQQELKKHSNRTVYIPTDQRTVASEKGKDQYTYYDKGGISWAAAIFSRGYRHGFTN